MYQKTTRHKNGTCIRRWIVHDFIDPHKPKYLKCFHQKHQAYHYCVSLDPSFAEEYRAHMLTKQNKTQKNRTKKRKPMRSKPEDIQRIMHAIDEAYVNIPTKHMLNNKQHTMEHFEECMIMIYNNKFIL